MSDFVVIAKIQIKPPLEYRCNLNESMEQYRRACNRISAFCFETRLLNQAKIQEHLYDELRDVYGLKSQMACSAIRTVIARYRTILETQNTWIKPNFKKPQLDLVWNRDYSLIQGVFSVNTLSGRMKCPFHSKGME